MGDLLIYLGRPEEAIEWLDRAKRTDPFFAPAWYWSTWGLALYLVERYDDAIVAYERSTLNTPWIAAYIGACHAQAGRLATARKIISTALHQLPELTIAECLSTATYKNPKGLTHIIDGMRKAGVPE